MIDALGGVGDSKLHSLDRAIELVSTRTVIQRDRRAGIHANIAAVISGEDHSLRHRYFAFSGFLAVYEHGHFAAFTQTATGVGELHAYLVFAVGQRTGSLGVE